MVCFHLLDKMNYRIFPVILAMGKACSAWIYKWVQSSWAICVQPRPFSARALNKNSINCSGSQWLVELVYSVNTIKKELSVLQNSNTNRWRLFWVLLSAALELIIWKHIDATKITLKAVFYFSWNFLFIGLFCFLLLVC